MTATKTIIIASLCGSTAAFQSPANNAVKSTPHSALRASSVGEDSSRPLFDPFNLYSENSEERRDGRVRALEPQVKVFKPVVDPLSIYPTNDVSIDGDVDMSESLPFMSRPAALTRDLVGDVGFDPLNFADTEEKLVFMREAELKHSRIAMLAAAGWPLSELIDKPLANMIHMKPLLDASDRVPSLLNGGLAKVSPFYWMLVLGLAGGFEVAGMMNKDDKQIFDPLNLFPADAEGKEWFETAEIKNGRLAMMAIVGFAVQECITNVGIIHQFPFA